MARIEPGAVAAQIPSTLPLAGARNALANILRNSREFVRRQLQGMARRRRIRATMAALDALDARTLKDIGLYRSEIHAVAAGTYGGRYASREEQEGLREPA